MPWMLLSDRTIATGLAWAAAVLTTIRFLRRRTDARLAAHWWTVLLLALSLTCEVPPVYHVVDHALGIPNAAFWLTHALALGSAYMADTFFFALTHGAERLSWHRLWLLVYLACTLLVMAVALWRIGLRNDLVPFDLPRVDPALIVYRVAFLAFLGLVMVRVSGTAAYYRQHTPDPLVKIGMSFLLAAGLWGLSYLVCRMATTLLPTTTPIARVLNVWLEGSVLMGILCLAVATLVPLWGTRLGVPALARHLSVMRTYWRLSPLWRALTHIYPEVVLPLSFSRRVALWHTQDLDFLLQRRVIEILDARRLLLTPVAPPARASVKPDWIATGDLAPRNRDGSISLRTIAHESVNTQHIRRLSDPSLATTSHGSDQRAQQAQQAQELERKARMEAWLVVGHLDRARHRRTTGVARDAAPLPTQVPFQPSTFEEAVSYLQCVADAVRRERWLHMAGHMGWPWRAARKNRREEEQQYA